MSTKPVEEKTKEASVLKDHSEDVAGDKPEIEVPDGKSEDGSIADMLDASWKLIDDRIDHIAGQAEVLYEAVIDEAVTKIVGSFAWANSTTLDSTILLTFSEIGTDDDAIDLVWMDWLYFLFVVLIIILLAYKLRKWLDYETGSEKKNINVQDKKPLAFIEKQFNDFKKAFSKLLLDTLAIVCALALRAATTTSFAEMSSVEYTDGYFKDDTSGLLGMTLIYALVITAIICWLSSKNNPTKKNVGSVDASLKKESEKSATKNDEKSVNTTDEKERDKSSKPLKDVIKTVSGLTIAFAWRSFFVVFIISIVGEVDSDVSGYWVYAIIITILATALLSIQELYTCCIPNFESLPFRRNSSEREYLGGVLVSALQYAVGLAWVDAFEATFRTMSTEDEMAANWAYCGIMIVVMVLSTLYLKKCLLKIAAEIGGILEFIDDNIDAIDFYDDWERNEGARRPFPVYLRDHFIELSMYAISLAAGFSISPAINATISYFLEDDPNADTVLGSWIAVVGVFIITTLVTLYLGTIVRRARRARKNAMELVERVSVKD